MDNSKLNIINTLGSLNESFSSIRFFVLIEANNNDIFLVDEFFDFISSCEFFGWRTSLFCQPCDNFVSCTTTYELKIHVKSSLRKL